MERGYKVYWRWLGRPEKAFFLLLAITVILHLVSAPLKARLLFDIATFALGVIFAIRMLRRLMKGAIWRLRNRLVATYILIAVVPIVLILALGAWAGYFVIGQVAVYLVNTNLTNREQRLLSSVEVLARVPPLDVTTRAPQGPPPPLVPFGDGRRGGRGDVTGRGRGDGTGRGGRDISARLDGTRPPQNPDRAIDRFVYATRLSFPEFEMVMGGPHALRFPPDTDLEAPPKIWERAHGLILRNDDNREGLYAWAHAVSPTNSEETVTAVAPITRKLLDSLAPDIGAIEILIPGEPPPTGEPPAPLVPEAKSFLDIPITGFYIMEVPTWTNPNAQRQITLRVRTRLFAVLKIIFVSAEWATIISDWLTGGFFFFLILELVSLYAGVRLSRTITSAVHELYEGTRRVKEGDFSYRIPVKGKDQLAELSGSFNLMTENLGRLIVVSKEKERLESELAIARDVQDQLFPKDAPFSKSLELKGLCNAARMVSGDYYDFMTLSDHSLAFAIGDVAGKGISAALLMATIQSTMRTQLSAMTNGNAAHLSTALMVANLNRQLYATTAPEKYATFYFAVHDEVTGMLTYTNAGHLAPMLLRDGTVQTLDSTGTVVGAFPVARYLEKKIQMQSGDLLVAYTDGIVEPENAYGEMFGEDRLKDLLLKYTTCDSSEIIARTMEAVNQWTGSSELQDDMTMVVARRL